MKGIETNGLEIKIQTKNQNKKEIDEITEVITKLVNTLDYSDFKFIKDKKIDLKKLVNKAKKNPVLLTFI